MFCSNCRALLPDDADFCAKCGAPKRRETATDKTTAEFENTAHLTPQTGNIRDVFEVYWIGVIGVTKQVAELSMTITPNTVKFLNESNKWSMEIRRDQANRKLFFPNKCYDGTGKSDHLNGLPLVQIETGDFLGSLKQSVAMSGDAFVMLRDWVPAVVKKDLKKDLNGWGISLILLGIAHIAFAQFLDPIWGATIILLGLLNILVTHRAMFILNGISLMLASMINTISATFQFGETVTLVSFLFVCQFMFGVDQIRRFRHYASLEVQGDKPDPNMGEHRSDINHDR